MCASLMDGNAFELFLKYCVWKPLVLGRVWSLEGGGGVWSLEGGGGVWLLEGGGGVIG